MAQTSYTTQVITAQTRKAAYRKLGELIDHIPHFPGVDIVSIVRNGNNSITITLSNPLSADQAVHLGL